MRCKTVKKNMFLYFENKLKPKKREKIIEHLKNCAWCMSEYKEGEHILNVMRSNMPKALPENLHKSIMQEVHGLRGYDEENKKEVKAKISIVVKRAGLTFASLLTLFLVMASIPYDLVQEKGLEGIDYISKQFEKVVISEKDEAAKSEINMSFGNADDEEAKNNESIKDEAEVENTQALKQENSLEKERALEDVKESISVENSASKMEMLDVLQINLDVLEESKQIPVSYSNRESIFTSQLDIEIMTNELEDAIDKIKDIVKENASLLVDKTIEYRNDDYRDATLIIEVNNSNIKSFKNLLSDEFRIQKEKEINLETSREIADNYKTIEELKISKISEEKKLDSIKDVEEKEVVNQNIDNLDLAIKQLEDKMNVQDNGCTRIIMHLKEVSDIEMDGIISFNSFVKLIGESFTSGGKRFLRATENVLIWASEHIIAIIFYMVAFLITYNVFKIIINGLKD